MAEPHYARMKTFIRDHITQGALKPGDRVPSEHELVAQFSVSRMTANRALKELAAEGLVIRRSGSGTFVAEVKATSPAPATAATAAGPQPDLADIEAVVKGHGHRYSRRVEQSRTLQASPVLMDAFGLATPQPISHHVLLHEEQGQPIQLESRYLNPALMPGPALNEPPPLARLADLADEAENTLEACHPDDLARRFLRVGPHEPCLRLERRLLRAGRTFAIVTLTTPATRHALFWRSKK
jgi:GntR family histidine utilization transcriptional repressor